MLRGVIAFSRALVPAVLALSACAHAPPRAPPFGPDAWASELDRQGPLVGKIWNPRAAAFADAAAVGASLARADVVVLGETHDNADHHALQAALLRALIASGRRPAVAFEMLDVDQQGAVDGALGQPGVTADGLASAVSWQRNGWPDFALYRPIFAASLEASLPIVAANLSRRQAQEVIRSGREALSPALRQRLDREGPLPEPTQRELRQEMAESHCGMLPAKLLDPMVVAQRARDAQMAERIEAGASERGVVLITGAGHARRDRGVPAFLSRSAPALRIASVAFLEVGPEVSSPQDFASEFGSELPFDFVVFTPRTKREDPCQGMRAHMERAHKAAPKPAS